jgi:3-oxoacyl-[acyl-carrier protein] reductase
MDLGLEHKTAIVTGASSGLGLVTALALANSGVRVAICGRTSETLEAAAARIEHDTGSEVMPFVADVRVAGDIERFVDATRTRFGSVDILVNNADSGGHDPPSFFEVTDEAWMARIEVKLLAAVRFARAAAPSMMERRWGRIINITSATTRRSTANNGGWTKGATQAGIVNLTKRLATSLGQHGITVNAVEPGRMNDDSAAGLSPESVDDATIEREQIARAASSAGTSFEEMERRTVAELVIGRRIRFQDTADVILFVASERSATITGEVILADGGQNPCVRY